MLFPNTPEWNARAKKNRKKARRRRKQDPQEKVDPTSRRNHKRQDWATFNDLNDDCLLQIMHHLELPEYTCAQQQGRSQQGRSPFENMLEASIRMKRLYKANRKAVITGMQEKQFPEYLPIFGRVGSQSAETLDNLNLALIKQRWSEDPFLVHPDQHCAREEPKCCGVMCEDCFVRFLKTLADAISREAELVQCLGATHHFCPNIVRRALVTLWRMGWFRLERKVYFMYERRIYIMMGGHAIWRIFQGQDRIVQDCLRNIIISLGGMIKRNLQLTLDCSGWALALSINNAILVPHAQQSYTNYACDIDAAVLLTIIAYGAEAAFDMKGDWNDKASMYLGKLLNRFQHSSSHIIRLRCRELESYVQLAENLGFNLGCLEGFDDALLRRARHAIIEEQA